jgi:NADH-quinone oxidoreductase subunit M
MHTREIDRYGGLANNMPGYAMLFLLFTMASVGLPGTSGFVGEFLALIGAYQANSWVALIATTGIILGAAYMLYLYWRVVYGAARTPEASPCPTSRAANGRSWRRSPRWCCGWASIPKASWRRCARTWKC